MMDHADTLGKPIVQSMLDELNRRIAEISVQTDRRDERQLNLWLNTSFTDKDIFSIAYASAYVFGDAPDEAFLNVEVIVKHHEFSPIILSFPLKTNYGIINVSSKYWDIFPTLSIKRVFIDYWEGIARLLTYKGNMRSIEESSVFATLSKCNITADEMTTHPFKNPIIGSNFLDALLSGKTDISPKLIVVADNLGSDVKIDSTDEYVYGSLKDELSPEVKKELVELLRVFATFHYPHTMTLFTFT